MIKQVAILFTIFILVQSQRPPYAGSNKPYPAVLPQYLDEQGTTTTTAAPSLGSVGNRIDVNNTSSTVLESAIPTTITTASTIPPDLPVDALGNIDLINKIKTWPREKQPFWFINWQKIQEHRGDSKNRAEPVQTDPNTRSFFSG